MDMKRSILYYQSKAIHLLNKRHLIVRRVNNDREMPSEHRLHKIGVLIPLIDAALRRIDKRAYGVCLECGKNINEKRLQVKPEAAKCRECQEKEDNDGKNR